MEENIQLLVVDDEERIRRLLKMYLEREGYDSRRSRRWRRSSRKCIKKMNIMYFIRYYDARKRWY